MKKRIVWFIFALSLLIALPLALADFNTYEKKSKTIPCTEDGLIFTITTYDGETESKPFVKCFGHTWTSVENRSGHSVYLKDYEIENGETVTISVWAISGHCGVFYNLEPNFISQFGRYGGRQSLSINIDESQLKVIEDYINQNDSWTLGNNCSRWSIQLWNELVDEEYALKTQTLLYSPKRIQKSFCKFDCVEFDKAFPGSKKIFYYREEIRTELELCS